jgi:anaphase-promoting complex subunit 6
MQVSCSKATTLEGSFAPAWLGFGNAYAAQDESDQAMAAYRTAARLFAGYYIGLFSTIYGFIMGYGVF